MVVPSLQNMPNPLEAFYEDEGLLLAIDGGQGSGKTTSLVAFGYEDYKATAKKVVSNNALNTEYIPDYRKLTLSYLIENMVNSEELTDIIVIWDETQKNMDSSARTRESRNLIYLLEEARKRRMSVYMSSQRLNKIDGRVRDMLDLRGVASTVTEKPCRKCKGLGYIVARGSDNEPVLCEKCLGYKKVSQTTIQFKRYTRKNPIMLGGNLVDFKGKSTFEVSFKANEYWHLFNTRERMAIQVKKMQHLDLAEIV